MHFNIYDYFASFITIRTSRSLFKRNIVHLAATESACSFFVLLNIHTREKCICTSRRHGLAIAFLFFDCAHVLESLEIISPDVALWDQGRIRGVLRLSPFSIHRSAGPLEYRGWLRPFHEMLTLTFSLCLSLFFPLSFSDSFPLPSQSNPHLYMCVEVEELQHPPADVSGLAIIVMDRTFSPPHQPIG